MNDTINQFPKNKLEFIVIFIFAILLFPYIALATDFTSTNFKVSNPVINSGSATSSSSSFKLISSIGQISISTSTSSSFVVKSGFLYFTDQAVVAPVSAPAAAGGNASLLEFFEELRKKITPEIPPVSCALPKLIGDLNCDKKVNLKDLSIFLYFVPQVAPNPADLNDDSAVNAKDLSLLFFGWTEKLLTFVGDDLTSTPKIAEIGKSVRLIPEGLLGAIIQKTELPKVGPIIKPYFNTVTELLNKAAQTLKQVANSILNFVTRFYVIILR